MEIIKLTEIKKINNQIKFSFTITDGLSDYFSGKPFIVEYPENIESVPDCIAAIPFVSNVLPIIWLTNSVLQLDELDKAFYDCIPNVRSGFEEMFPESEFKGQIQVDKIVECDIASDGGSATFFSGGLDAVNTLVSHFDEKPALISIWGSDIRFDNVDGWHIVHKGIADYSEKYNLHDVVIRSSFRDFDNEGALHRRFSEQLKDSWWHGVKHGIGLLGHAAPYAYLHKLSAVYIASSNCPANNLVRCSSSPLTDNHVRFAKARVIHDGYEFSRQDKVHNVVEYVKSSGDQVTLHVCWESQSGDNCCQCEKCYRTIVGLIAEGSEPFDFGFKHAQSCLKSFQKLLVDKYRNSVLIKNEWTHIQKKLIANRTLLKNSPYWKDVKWLVKADLMHPETLKRPLTIREKLSQYKFYQMLHELKVKFRG